MSTRNLFLIRKVQASRTTENMDAIYKPSINLLAMLHQANLQVELKSTQAELQLTKRANRVANLSTITLQM